MHNICINLWFRFRYQCTKYVHSCYIATYTKSDSLTLDYCFIISLCQVKCLWCMQRHLHLTMNTCIDANIWHLYSFIWKHCSILYIFVVLLSDVQYLCYPFCRMTPSVSGRTGSRVVVRAILKSSGLVEIITVGTYRGLLQTWFSFGLAYWPANYWSHEGKTIRLNSYTKTVLSQRQLLTKKNNFIQKVTASSRLKSFLFYGETDPTQHSF